MKTLILITMTVSVPGIGSVFGAVIGTNVAALPLTAERIAALPAGQQAAWRTYLARSAEQMRADRAAKAALTEFAKWSVAQP